VFAGLGFTQPGLQGLMTSRVAPAEQGRLQGANQSLQGLAWVGPVIFGMTFAWSVRREATLHAPGLAFFVASALMATAFVFAVKIARPTSASPPGDRLRLAFDNDLIRPRVEGTNRAEKTADHHGGAAGRLERRHRPSPGANSGSRSCSRARARA